jgi:eukaryotic-like serine/threonine-protein kinase
MAKKKNQQIGRYKILGELGRGAMGVVYRAEDPALDREVALKTIILSDDADERKAYQKRFFQEAKAAGKLTHPNIVTTYDFGEEEDVAYLAMELLEGTELRERMKEGAFAPAEAVDIARQVADALGFAHERGVVHRDVKPGNIMLLARGQAKIMDFGIARMRATADFKTSTGMVLGTPKYMSPEQIAGLPVDQRSDVFSLGIVLYEMLTGARLFDGEDVTQITHKVTTAEPEPPTRVNPELPAMLDFIVARALKKDPAVRYQDAYELAADLATCLAELRGREGAEERNGKNAKDTTKTVKLEATEKAPAARSIAIDTRLPVSRQFDSSAGLRRIAKPSRRDLKRLSRGTRPVGILRRLWHDRAPQRLAIVLLAAAIASSWIVLG